MHRIRLRLRYGGVTVPDAREREKTNSGRSTTFCEGGHGRWIERERHKREKRREKRDRERESDRRMMAFVSRVDITA